MNKEEIEKVNKWIENHSDLEEAYSRIKLAIIKWRDCISMRNWHLEEMKKDGIVTPAFHKLSANLVEEQMTGIVLSILRSIFGPLAHAKPQYIEKTYRSAPGAQPKKKGEYVWTVLVNVSSYNIEFGLMSSRPGLTGLYPITKSYSSETKALVAALEDYDKIVLNWRLTNGM